MTEQATTFATIIGHAFNVHVQARPITELVGKTITGTHPVTIENGFTTDHGTRFTFTDGTSYTLLYPTPAPF